jgi:hypothetical protein
MLAELADKAASVFMKVSDEQLRSRITALETELMTVTTGHSGASQRSLNTVLDHY